MYRTSFFYYNDNGRIKASCAQHGVICTSNGSRWALIASSFDKIMAVLDACFDHGARTKVELNDGGAGTDGIVYVNFG